MYDQYDLFARLTHFPNGDVWLALFGILCFGTSSHVGPCLADDGRIDGSIRVIDFCLNNTCPIGGINRPPLSASITVAFIADGTSSDHVRGYVGLNSTETEALKKRSRDAVQQYENASDDLSTKASVDPVFIRINNSLSKPQKSRIWRLRFLLEGYDLLPSVPHDVFEGLSVESRRELDEIVEASRQRSLELNQALFFSARSPSDIFRFAIRASKYSAMTNAEVLASLTTTERESFLQWLRSDPPNDSLLSAVDILVAKQLEQVASSCQLSQKN